MKYLFCLLLLAGAAVHGQDLTASIYSASSGETSLGSPYVFSAIPAGSASSITVRLRNNSGNPVMIAAAVANSAAGMFVTGADLTFTNSGVWIILASSVSTIFYQFTINFAPLSVGLLTAYLQVTYQIQQNGCNFTSQVPAQQCTSQTQFVSILQGSGTS